jgi:hypothetical protein
MATMIVDCWKGNGKNGYQDIYQGLILEEMHPTTTPSSCAL